MKKRKNKQKKYMFIIIPVVAVSVGIGALAFSQENKQELITNNTNPSLGGSPILGDSNASVTIVEWGDYQCTYCHRFHQDTKDEVFSNYVDNGKIRFAFRDFPLNGPASVMAAEAAYCAGDQDKYWGYHDELYSNWEGENTGWVNMHNLMKFASNLNLDLDTFEECVKGHKYKQKVLDNYRIGQNLGISATPSFLVIDGNGNAQRIVGAQPYAVFEQVLDQKLSS